MCKIMSILLLSGGLIATAVSAKQGNEMKVIPYPKKIATLPGTFQLRNTTRVMVRDKTLAPLSKILADGVYRHTGIKLKASSSAVSRGTIVLSIDPALKEEAYTLVVGDSVEIKGGDYRAVAWGTATLLQLIETTGKKYYLPKLSIEDQPTAQYRGVMLDVARRWHPVTTLKEAIALFWMYKINYLHLHLSDNQSFVFPSKTFPKLATKGRSYSSAEMKDIVRFADEHGVTIVPEIDMPGHAGSWVGRRPELFGTTDPKTGKSRGAGIVNMANEKAYTAIDQLIGDLADVFKSSPYIHVGTDEVGAGGLMKLPEYKAYCEKHGLTEALEGRAHELYLHFIYRMNEIVRKHGRQTIAWSDFGGASTPNVTIPTNLIAMVWMGSPVNLANKKYPIINSCWLPLYMVPPQQRAPEAYRIYDWNMHQFGNWQRNDPIVLPDEVPIMGANMCFWEQRYNEVIPILRPRVPAYSERLWNPDAEKTFDDFKVRRSHTDKCTQNILYPVSFGVNGLLDPADVTFDTSLSITMQSSLPGTIRYTVEKPWESYPSQDSKAYSKPITIDDTMTVSARLYDEQGQPVGGITQQRFRKILPAYTYHVLGPTPHGTKTWKTMPDFSTLDVLRTGVTGLMDKDRADQINRSMFAGLPGFAHVDVRVHDVYNVLTLELKGQIQIPKDGEYTFQLISSDGMSSLTIGDKLVVSSSVPGRKNTVKGKLKAGHYPITIKHFFRRITNNLNIQTKLPGEKKFQPFETLVVPQTDWKKESELSQLDKNVVFVDAEKLANMNLATGKPVTSSGGTQGDMVPANAVDGVLDNSSGWHADPYPQWLQVDLKKITTFNRLKVHTFYDNRRYYQYTIEASLDGKKRQQIVDMTKNVEISTKKGFEHNIDPCRARYVRINMLRNSANPGVHLNELMIFEAK